MITLTKSGNAIVFTFDDNDHYLNDGKIEVPVNSLTLVTDESQMATFKKSATNDIFISARYDELGMSKSDLESWFKENAFDTGGGGKAIVAGRGISVTTGATADTVSFDLPISAGTGTNSIIGGDQHNVASNMGSIALGGWYNSQWSYNTCTATGKGAVSFGGTASGEDSFSTAQGQAKGRASVAIGCYYSEAIGKYSFATGRENKAKGFTTFVSGYQNIGENDYEFVAGHCAKSNKANTTFGDSGNTLFSVGNGTSSAATHNAFEIRQNGDIYITSGGTDIKLQDNLGGGGNNVIELTQAQYDALTDIDPTAFYIITDAQSLEARLSEDEEVTAAALNELNNTIGDINTILQSI